MDDFYPNTAGLAGQDSGSADALGAVAVAVASAIGGNRCGHDPANPRYFVPPEKHQDRPRILRKLEEKIRAYFDDPRKTIPSLDLANGKDRQQRSERREACLAVLGCMIHFLDLVTLRVGVPTPGGFRGLTVPYLAELSGLGERRTERALHDLVKAKLITVHPLCERKDDHTFKGYAAIRTISATLFALFGLGRWLPHEREKAAARLRKKRRRQDEAELAKVKLALGGLANGGHPNPSASAGGCPVAGQATPHAEGLKKPLEYLAAIKDMLSGKGPPP
jgi:hypothetical protein